MTRTRQLLVLLSVVAGGVGLWAAGAARHRARDARKLNFARQLVLTGRAEEAVAMIASRPPQPVGSPARRAWMKVAVEAFEQAGDAARLGQIYYQDPSLLGDHEEASLLASRALILRNDIDSFQRLRGKWRGREQSPHAWMVLEADALLRQGRRAQALALLTENPLEGDWDASRQVRLALLHASEPEQAWRHLTEAIRRDPGQAVARLFRAQLLEAAGRVEEARLEYVAARLTQPHNSALCDQLAEYYRRRGAYGLMLDTWLEADGRARGDFIDFKAAFWSKVAQPAPRPLPPPVAGPLRSLVDLIHGLPPTQFWDESQVAQLDGAHRAAESRPEVRWLRILEHLRNGHPAKALALLETAETVAWETPLRRSLLMTLNLRLHGELDPDARLRTDATVAESRHPLLAQLDHLHMRGQQPEAALRSTLGGPHGPSLTLMANGWLRAAVLLEDEAPLPVDAPPWAAYGMAQAYRLVEGPQAALDYVARQPATPALHLLAGELQLERGEHDAAHQRLAGVIEAADLAEPLSAAVARAHWLTVVSLLELQRHDEALSHLEAHPAFAASPSGQELRARIALLQHDADTAARLYGQLRDRSVEAQVFLARSAAHDGDWRTAEQLTLDLLEQFPANQQLLRSLIELRKRMAEQRREGVSPVSNATSVSAPSAADGVADRATAARQGDSP